MPAPESFVTQYVETMLWAETDNKDESGGEPLDRNYDSDDIAPDSMAKIRQECDSFYDAHSADFDAVDDEQAAHDFWLTRNGHGAGFWDGDWPEPEASRLDAAAKAAGERNIYVGDDERLHYS